MPAYVKMKDFTSHYQKPADCSGGISWLQKCATTAKICSDFRHSGLRVRVSALLDDLDDWQEIKDWQMLGPKDS